jgi:hypothetical protein
MKWVHDPTLAWSRHTGPVALRQVWYHVSRMMGVMGKVFLVLALLIIVAIAGGGLYLAYAHATVTPQKVEKVLPDARFPR